MTFTIHRTRQRETGRLPTDGAEGGSPIPEIHQQSGVQESVSSLQKPQRDPKTALRAAATNWNRALGDPDNLIDFKATWHGQETQLFAAQFPPPAGLPHKGFMVLTTGYNQSSVLFSHVVEEANRRGLTVLTFDWPGQGLSNGRLRDESGRPRQTGDAQSMAEFTRIFDRFVREQVQPRVEERGGPVINSTHSMGGHIVLDWWAKNESFANSMFHRGVFSAPAVKPVAARRDARVWNWISGLWSKVTDAFSPPSIFVGSRVFTEDDYLERRSEELMSGRALQVDGANPGEPIGFRPGSDPAPLRVPPPPGGGQWGDGLLVEGRSLTHQTLLSRRMLRTWAESYNTDFSTNDLKAARLSPDASRRFDFMIPMSDDYVSTDATEEWARENGVSVTKLDHSTVSNLPQDAITRHALLEDRPEVRNKAMSIMFRGFPVRNTGSAGAAG